jgi:N-acetylglucosamine-6-phosphate deacetylase
MSPEWRLVNATLVLPDRLVSGGAVHVRNGVIQNAGAAADLRTWDGPTIDARAMFAAPGFVDMHVHGGGGADFMDGSVEAFQTAIRAHTRHGTTSIVPTSTVARHEQTLRFLETCQRLKNARPAGGGARVAGAHLYGPYFAEEKVGCHPRDAARPPTPGEYERYLEHAGDGTLLVATCAPELPGAAGFYRAARAKGVRLNAGHSNASWDEMQAAYDLGVRHVDHFFCAMSNYVSLRSRFGAPMRGGMMEFVLATADMTTELIADGRHLAPELLRFVLAMKGPDRTALVTDCMRALDLPPGDYVFGPTDGGETVYSDGSVGLMPDRTGLASSVRGMDFMVRHVHQAAGIDLPTAVRMASLTPAKILGLDGEIGSLEAGKRADILLLDKDLQVNAVWVGGRTQAAGTIVVESPGQPE